MDRVLDSWLAAHHALEIIAFQNGNFEEGMELVELLLMGALLRYEGVASQPFFFFDGCFLGRTQKMQLILLWSWH